jgi:hypothetical protein
VCKLQNICLIALKSTRGLVCSNCLGKMHHVPVSGSLVCHNCHLKQLRINFEQDVVARIKMHEQGLSHNKSFKTSNPKGRTIFRDGLFMLP